MSHPENAILVSTSELFWLQYLGVYHFNCLHWNGDCVGMWNIVAKLLQKELLLRLVRIEMCHIYSFGIFFQKKDTYSKTMRTLFGKINQLVDMCFVRTWPESAIFLQSRRSVWSQLGEDGLFSSPRAGQSPPPSLWLTLLKSDERLYIPIC